MTDGGYWNEILERQTKAAVAAMWTGIIEREKKSRVYFARLVGFDIVKIGFSKNTPERMRVLREETKHRHELIGSIVGGRTSEATLHRRFRAHAIAAEYFWWSPIRPEIEAILDGLAPGPIPSFVWSEE